jgi:hypothetical protein
LKLPPLLSQFLYQHRKLDLPGIGSFSLDPGGPPPDPEKAGQPIPSGVIFRNTQINAADDTLINFIKEHTGKMKSLAAADLDFFLTTGRQLLNIGKPFYLEGIGTLTKNRDGHLDFTPGEYHIALPEEGGVERKTKQDKKKEAYHEAPREAETHGTSGRQTLLLIGIIIGLIAIGWGGYHLYKKNTYVESPPENQSVTIREPAATGARDTTSAGTAASGTSASGIPAKGTADSPAHPRRDSSAPKPAPIAQPAAPEDANQKLYKFVILQTYNKGHALRRYNQLLGYQLNIKMDQKDSAFFKLYFPISATVKDTSHIKDSLVDVYAAHVSIEN